MAPLQWRDHAPADGGKPLVSYDLHVEAPSSKRRRMTILDKERETSKIIFNKTIEGRYRDGKVGYEEVGVLFLTWKDDDLFCGRQEVPELHDLFRYKFGFTTEKYEIPSERSATALSRAIADFAYRFDSPNKMAIVYYGGHGMFVEGRLQLFAKNQGDWEGDPSAFFDDAIHTLKLPDTDILVILDCCYAARAFSRNEMGRRKFELFSATPPLMMAKGPEHHGSFTKVFTRTLARLLEDSPEGFSTSKLYREVYFNQDDKRKPFLFDQSPFDYGKIWLKPFPRMKQPEATSTRGREPKITIDLQLQLSSMPDQLMMNQLARAMQYLPHVRRLEFQHLHAPEEELKEYMRGLKQAMVLKPLVAKLRRRLAQKRLRKQGMEVSLDDRECPSQSPLNTKLRDNSLNDWSTSQLDLSSAIRRTSVSQMDVMRLDAVKEEPAIIEQATHEQIIETEQKYYIGSWLSFSYSLDLSGLRSRLIAIRHHDGRQWSPMFTQQRTMFGFFGLFAFCCVAQLCWNYWSST